jgi:hypothetical protein
MAGRAEEVFYVVCLDSRLRVLFPALVGEGTVKDALVHPRHVVEAALRHRAAAVILATTTLAVRPNLPTTITGSLSTSSRLWGASTFEWPIM